MINQLQTTYMRYGRSLPTFKLRGDLCRCTIRQTRTPLRTLDPRTQSLMLENWI